MRQAVRSDSALREVAFIAKWMDSKFRIPGTDIRFGLDGILGLIPGVGDLSTFAVSSYMMVIMAKNGASGYVLARMALNIIVDALIGSIPVIGDLFDFAFKANIRNLKLMQEHFEYGRHRGSAWKVIIPLLFVLLLMVAGIIWGMYELLTWIF